ncbi:MAG: type VI secretion system transmembrane protein TssO [Paludibacteraceae bacterium]|nr:type VI secretion system transmembrane protein TssO [Paludibacteraceae bacterium]
MNDAVMGQMNNRERTIVFFYVLIIFLVASVLCCFILFFVRTDYQFADGKQAALEQMSKVESFRKVQMKELARIQFVDGRIAKVDPSLNASYEKREINYSLGEIRKLYVKNKHDDRYRMFEYVALFYEMRMFDKERLWSSKKNIELFNADLERCRSGVEKKKLNFMQ